MTIITSTINNRIILNRRFNRRFRCPFVQYEQSIDLCDRKREQSLSLYHTLDQTSSTNEDKIQNLYSFYSISGIFPMKMKSTTTTSYTRIMFNYTQLRVFQK